MKASSKYAAKQEFLRHIKALNSLFNSWIQKQAKDNAASLIPGCQDYIDYAKDLERKYLKTYGEVLTFGSGDCGQLAHGIEDDDLQVKYPRVVYSLRDKKVCGISCGGLHNAVFTETGQVYTWGCSDDGSLGRPGDENMPGLIEQISHEFVIGVSCGDGQTLALTTNGDVYGWGCFKDKEGGKWFSPDPAVATPSQDIKKQQNLPIKINGLKNIAELACGSSFSLARTDDGQVYSWGISECGELGRETVALKAGRDKDESFLTKVLADHLTPGFMYLSSGKAPMKNVKAIGCGSYHSLVVSVGGKVYASGLNNYSQLGTGNTDNEVYLKEVVGLEGVIGPVINVKGGMHHSLALDCHGIMAAWGRSDYYQLGNSSSSSATLAAGSYSSTPVKPSLPEGVFVAEIACGGNHNLALTSSNSVYTWGYGDMLALGHGYVYPNMCDIIF